MIILLFIVALLFVPGCSHSGPAAEAHPRCNPLGGGAGEDCLLPFPSSFFTVADPTTATGVRVDLSRASLPRSRFGTALDPAPYSGRDGFSAVATLLAHFPPQASLRPIDTRGLPTPRSIERSLRATGHVQLIRFDTGERVPLFAELDANAQSPEHQALILQPTVRLRPKTRYVAVIQGLHDTGGAELRPLSGFRALRDRATALDPALEALRPRYDEIFARLAELGLARNRLQLAWDFTTGSDEAVTGRLVRMRDYAQSYASYHAADAPEPVRIDRVEEHPDNAPNLWLRLTGTFTVPSFLEGGNGNRLKTDEHGQPLIDGFQRFPLTIHVPECAKSAKGPLPILIYGHGTFNSAREEMATDYSTGVLEKLCMIEVGTDWIGRAKSDFLYFAFRIIPNWNNFPQITDRLQQAHVNMATLARLLHGGALNSVPELARDGHPLADASKVYYLGISEGGCQGVTALALSPDIQRGALNVPCGFWSMFFWRSSDFHLVRRALKLSYPSPLDQQKLMMLSQLQWDYTDPANYGAHLLRDPLPGSTVKSVLYQEGINDASVPNLTTRAMARTIGLKLLGPGVEPVYGIEVVSGPQKSAYVQYDVGVRPRLGGDNVPPSVSAVHEEIRRLEPVQEQLKRFLREDGAVEDVCGGKPCVFDTRMTGSVSAAVSH